MKKTIGQMIEEAFHASGMSKNEFADKICCSRQNIYSIFKKENIDVDSLMRISKVLDHDFLLDLSSQPKPKEDRSFEKLKAEMQRRALILCNAYLPGKKRTPCYLSTVLTECINEVEVYVHLSQDEVDACRKVTLEEGCYLTNVIDEINWWEKIDTVDLGYGELIEVISIDFTPRYLYTFTCYEVESPTAKPTIEDYYVELTDEQYIRLLVMLMENGNPKADYLLEKDSELYHKIYGAATVCQGRFAPRYPYLVFMKEARKDVDEIRRLRVED